jgi:NADH-quinone oxidoreductase subunit L
MIASLSLAGMFPLAGFWSKDEILVDAWNDNQALFWIALSVVFLTSFYMFRAIFMTFEGDYQGGESSEEPGHGADPSHPHESPWVMVLPLAALAVPAALIGFANINGGVEHLLVGALPEEVEGALHETTFSWPIAIGSTAMALAGIGTAWLFYGLKVLSAERVRRALRPVHMVLENKYYLDYLYEQIIVRRIVYDGFARFFAWFDANVVDGVSKGIQESMRMTSSGLRLVQTGQVQVYGAVGLLGIVLAGGLIFILNPI